MHRKFLFGIFFIFVIFNFFFVNAAVSTFPEGGSASEMQNWVLSNPDDFDVSDSLQTDALISAYNNNKINLNEESQRKVVEKYLTSLDEVPLDERNLLRDFVSYHVKEVNIDLSKGQGISLDKSDGKLFLKSSDGQEHSLEDLNAFEIEGKKLDGIKSLDDGTIELVYGENSIRMKDSAISRNKFGEFVFGDGKPLELSGDFGKLTLEGNGFSCGSELCRLSRNGMDVELNSGGTFQDLGNNRFSVVDGTTKIDGDVIAGSYEFSTNSQETGIDFSHKIDLRKFSPDGTTGLKSSYVKIDNSDFGNVVVNTGKSEKGVAACFDCTDLANTGDYDGYAELKKQSKTTCITNCGKDFEARIKGFAAVQFEEDVIHQGFDESLLVSYDNSEGTFRLEGCENCAVGNKQVVGIQALNGNLFNIRNEYYDESNDKRKVPQMVYRLQRNGAGSFIPVQKFILGNDEGITFADKDVYTTRVAEDYLNTGVFSSSSLMGKEGGRSLKKYVEEYHQRRLGDTLGISFESQDLAQDTLGKVYGETTYGRKFYIEDLNAFNFDSRDRRIDVAKLYVVNGDGSVLVEQVDPGLLREYSSHFKIDGESLKDSYERDRKLLASIIDAGRGQGEYNERVSSGIRSILRTYPSADAEKALGNYEDVIESTEEIEKLYARGFSLGEICRSPIASVEAGCNEPRMNYAWKKDAGTLTDSDVSYAVNAYTTKGGDYLYNPLHGVEILADYTSEKLKSPQDKNVFLNYVNSLETQGADIIPKTSLTNFLEGVEYVELEEGYIPVRDREMVRLIREGKVSKQTLRDLSKLVVEYDNDEFSRGLKLAGEALVPKDVVQLGLNVASALGPIGKSFVVLGESQGLFATSKALGSLGLKGIGATLIGYSGSSNVRVASNVDEISSLLSSKTDEIRNLGKIPYNPATQKKLFFNSLALKLEKELQLAPEEKIEIVALNNKFPTLGNSNEKVGVLAVVKVNSLTGEKRAIKTGFLHPDEKGALKHIENLNVIDSKLANEHGVNFNQGFAGAVSYDGPVKGTIVFRKPSTRTFAEEIRSLPKEDRDPLLDLYNGCCEPRALSDAPSVSTEEGLYRLIPRDGTPINVESGVLPQVVHQNTLLQIMSGKSPDLKPLILDTESGVEGYFGSIGKFYEGELQLRPNSLDFRSSPGSLTNDVGIFYEGNSPVFVSKVYEGPVAALKEAENLASVNLIEKDLVPQVLDIANVPSIKSVTGTGSDTGVGSMIIMEAVPGESLDTGLNTLGRLSGSAKINQFRILESQVSGAGEALARLHNALPKRELVRLNPSEIEDSSRNMRSILSNLDIDSQTKSIYDSKIKQLGGKVAQSDNLIAFGHRDLHLDNILVDKGTGRIIDLETGGIVSNRGTDLARYADALRSSAQRTGLKDSEINQLVNNFYDNYFKKYSSSTGVSRSDFDSMVEFSEVQSALTRLQATRDAESVKEARAVLDRILGS